MSIISEDRDKCHAFSDYLSKVYTCEPDGYFERLEPLVPLHCFEDLAIDMKRISKIGYKN